MLVYSYRCNRCDGVIAESMTQLYGVEHFRCGGKFMLTGSKEISNLENKDKVNPSHYTSLSPQPIDVIESWGLGYHLGTAVKYIARAGKKEEETALDDLLKARWYLDREIGVLEGLNSRIANDLEWRAKFTQGRQLKEERIEKNK